MIRSVVFDFDGTLLLSNAVKEESFYAIAEAFPGGGERMRAILKSRPGDRSAILKQFADAMQVGDRADDLIARYTSICSARIMLCPERPGASSALAALRAAGIRLCVNSSTPIQPLRAIAAARFPAATFDDVFGGYGCKLDNLRRLAEAAQLRAADIAMVGDGSDDAEAAAAFGCHFVGVSGGSLRASGSAPLIDDLRDLLPLLGRMEGCVRS